MVDRLYTCIRTLFITVFLVGSVAACAPATMSPDDDILEPVNRQLFAFNEVVDDAILEPLAQGYRYTTTPGIREAVSNFFTNVSEPVTFFSSILQGDFEGAMTAFWRFTLNSTFGFAGLHDFAGIYGNLPHRGEDFGQALASWGVPSGPYLVLPILGPSNLRDMFGSYADSYGNLLVDGFKDWEIIGFRFSEGVTKREKAIELVEELYDTSFDPYASLRSLYIQNRNAQILNNHNPHAK